MNDSPRRVGQDATGAEEDQFKQQNSTASSDPFQSEKNSTVAFRQTTDDAACHFLQLILPEQGPYIAWIKTSEGRKYNVFASTISELWSIIKSANDAGHAAYHACANFDEARHDPVGTPRSQRQYGRTKRNVRGAKALWIDEDAGAGKPYANAEEAHRALLEFCKKADLPSSLIVRSGNGLHAYWPLECSLDRGTWERHAHGLKTLCIKHGLHADHSRTTDISSVLRTPGTHHRKGEAKEVLCGSMVGPFSISALPIVAEDPDSRTKATSANSRRSSIRSGCRCRIICRPFRTAGGWKLLFIVLMAAEILDQHPARLPRNIVDSWQNSATSKGKSPNRYGTPASACWRTVKTVSDWHTRGQSGTVTTLHMRHKKN